VKPKDGSASQSCTVKDDDDVDRVKAGDQVEMTCSQVAGAWVLTKVRKK
jgi:Cu/Ag efflux protein CusF